MSKDSNKFVEALAAELSTIKELEPPVWSKFVKTGAAKARSPENASWWFVRAASVLRCVHVDGPVGTSRLRVVYGSRKRRGTEREHFYKASGAILRKMLQQLEAGGLIKQTEKPKRGRAITPKGQKFINGVAKSL